VLNVVGDESSVKYLLKAIRDTDWWVRSRAADALGKIGGPQVITAGARARLGQGRRGAPHRGSRS
jgi:HEAT repeat protein